MIKALEKESKKINLDLRNYYDREQLHQYRFLYLRHLNALNQILKVLSLSLIL